jgi:hypothetical protein
VVGGDLDREVLPGDARVGVSEVKGARDEVMLQSEQDLEHAADARGSLGVTEVGLDGADEDRALGGSTLSERGAESLQFNSVAERSTCAVGLDVIEGVWSQGGSIQSAADDGLLGGAVGSCHAVAAAILVDGRAADESEDGVAVALGVRQALEHEHAAALAPSDAVGGGVKALASAIRSEAAEAAELDVDGRGESESDAAGEGGGALARAQALAGEVDGDEGGGASGIDGEAWALEAEEIRDAAGSDAGGVAEEHVAVVLIERAAEQGFVIVVHQTDEDACVGGHQVLGQDASELEGLPGDFEEEALLGVDLDGLARRDAEEGWVKQINAVEEATGASEHLSGLVRVRMVAGVDVPTLRRYLAYGVDAVVEQSPEGLRVVDAAREPATEADNGDGLIARGVMSDGEGRRGGSLGRRELVEQIERQGASGRIVEVERGGQRLPEAGGKRVSEFDGGERVEAKLLQRAIELDVRGWGQGEYLPDVSQHSGLDLGGALLGGKGEDAVDPGSE